MARGTEVRGEALGGEREPGLEARAWQIWQSQTAETLSARATPTSATPTLETSESILPL